MHVNSYESPLNKPSTVCTYWIKEKGLYTSDDSFDNDSAFIPTQPRVEGAGEDEGADQKTEDIGKLPNAVSKTKDDAFPLPSLTGKPCVSFFKGTVICLGLWHACFYLFSASANFCLICRVLLSRVWETGLT